MSKIILAKQSAAPSQPNAGKVALYVDNTATPQLKLKDEYSVVVTQLDNVHSAVLVPGTSALAPLNFPSTSALKTAPAIGDMTNDGNMLYYAPDATMGFGQIPAINIYRLTGNGVSFTTPATDAFIASGSGFPFVTNAVLLVECLLISSKTSNGTVTWTLKNSQNYTAAQMFATHTPLAGVATGAATAEATVAITAAATIATVSGTLIAGVNHVTYIWAILECGTAGNIRLQGTTSAGSAQLLRGSFMKMTRLSAGNAGLFVA